MTANDIRRHPAYKHGFEGHRKFLNNGRKHPDPREGWTSQPRELRGASLLPGESFSVTDIWLAGAHAGMRNTRGWSNFPIANWQLNLEPLYDPEYEHVQLDLFSD